MRKLETEIENEKYLLLKPITYSPDKLKTISDQKRQKSVSQVDTAGLSRASLPLIFLGLHKPILRVDRGNDMKSTP